MEDLLSDLDEKTLEEIMMINLVKDSPKLKHLCLKLSVDRTKFLDDKLKEKYQKVLQGAKEKISALEKSIETQTKDKKPVRLYMDGVFDIIHSGHFNALRQAYNLGDVIVCGVNSDEDVRKAKGPTLMNIEERAALAGASKWVEEAKKDTPYTPTIETLDSYKCDYLTHGDDIPFNEHGQSCYDEMFKHKRIRIFPRTEGISTTVITGRLILSLKEKFDKLDETNSEIKKMFKEIEEMKNLQNMTTLLTTSYRISEFSNRAMPKPNDKIVYLAGDFDILHKGHIEALRKAKELGDFVYVGVFDDNTCNKRHGKNYPILNINERCLNLLALRDVDDVIFGVPEVINEDLIKSLKVNTVVKFVAPGKKDEEKENYEIPRKLGVLKEVEVSIDLSNDVLTERIWQSKEQYIKKYLSKAKKPIVCMSEDQGQQKKQQP